jgi:hypothetical protein
LSLAAHERIKMFVDFDAFELCAGSFRDGVERFARRVGYEVQMKLLTHNLSSGMPFYPEVRFHTVLNHAFPERTTAYPQCDTPPTPGLPVIQPLSPWALRHRAKATHVFFHNPQPQHHLHHPIGVLLF